MVSTPRSPVRVALGLVALIPLLAACAGGDPEPSSSTTPEPSSQVSTPVTPAETPSTSASASTSATTTTTSTGVHGMPADVEDAYEVFGSLAPLELFEQFDTCDPNGVEDSSACTGREVGQFQFFDNAAKAASTTQLLTELRSSRVVSDTGDKIVGWSTIGTMSIITVVDNDRGLVLQQMISSDQIDPADRIYELGLLERPEGTTPEPTTGGATTSSTAAQS